MSKNSLHQLMYGLLYPAVLGTLFVLFVSDDLASRQLSPRFLFGLVFLVHWCLEFLLANQAKAVSDYTVPEFIGDLILIFVMYRAFLALPPTKGLRDYASLYLWIMLVPVVFLAVDIVKWVRANDPLLRPVVVVDIVFFLAALAFLIAAAYRDGFRRNDTAAYLFVAATAIASVASFFARKSRFVQVRT